MILKHAYKWQTLKQSLQTNPLIRFCRAVWSGSTLFLSLLVLPEEQAVAKRAAESAFSLFPYAGLTMFTGDSITSMNQRLGNSARLSQPYAFGNQLSYGVQIGFWGRDQRQYYGLNILMSEKELTGTSTFQGVGGTSSLKLSGYLIEYGYRFLPFGTRFRPSKPKGIRDRVKLSALAAAGYFSVENQNDIEDTGSDTLISYHYSSARLGIGGGVKGAIVLLPWLHLIVFDLKVLSVLSLSSQVNLSSYRVGGRDESSLAREELQKELNAAILAYSAAWGVEFSL